MPEKAHEKRQGGNTPTFVRADTDSQPQSQSPCTRPLRDHGAFRFLIVPEIAAIGLRQEPRIGPASRK